MGFPLLPGFLELLDLTGPVLVPPPPEPPLDLTHWVARLLAQTLYAALAAKRHRDTDQWHRAIPQSDGLHHQRKRPNDNRSRVGPGEWEGFIVCDGNQLLFCLKTKPIVGCDKKTKKNTAQIPAPLSMIQQDFLPPLTPPTPFPPLPPPSTLPLCTCWGCFDVRQK